MKNLLYGVEFCGYMASGGDKYLQDGIIVEPMPAFKENGANLTITFLSLNRVNLSIRLIESIKNYIPNFEGKILIIDNGSNNQQLDLLRQYVANINLDIKIKELDHNFGVAGGRNRAIEFIDTDWFMSLDNDIYFVDNPLGVIKECIDKLGVHFLNLPLLKEDGYTVFSLGGSLWLAPYKDTYCIGCGTSFRQTLKTEFLLEQPFLSTFLFGGASVIRKQSFIEQGYYDENMFIGFEDVDFSLRLYKKGIKVGNVSSFCLIHGHEPPLIKEDIEYERIRFSQQKIKESGMYFFAKHNIHVWTDDVNNWITEREEQLGLNRDLENINSNLPINPFTVDSKQIKYTHNIINSEGKPRIALVVDVANWAFHNITKQIITNLENKYNFQVFMAYEYENPALILLEVHDFDLIHFFWRVNLQNLLQQNTKTLFKKNEWDYENFIAGFVPELNITSSVFDHLYLSEAEIPEWEVFFNALTTGYTTSSERLSNIYSSINKYSPPSLVVEDGVDTEKFFPRNLERFCENNREIIIGWVGNSEWGMNLDGKDHKGLKTLIKPAIEALREEFPVRGVYADRAEKWIPHEQMLDYYNSIDIYVCASDIEGTPNPVLEAMACGIPVISTDVGIVPQVFGPLQSKFILPSRTLEALKEKLRLLLGSPETRKRLSEENLERIQAWTWKAQCHKWDLFFQQMLNQTEEQRRSRTLLRKLVLEKHIACISTLERIEIEKASLQERIEAEKANLQNEKAILHQRIEAMESSKFWKFRKIWFKVKRQLGLTQEEP